MTEQKSDNTNSTSPSPSGRDGEGSTQSTSPPPRGGREGSALDLTSPSGRTGGANTGSYFELYNITPSFHPDPATVKTRFYELSRRYHPDRFATAPAAEMAEALRMAALNNQAYKTLKSPDATMAYILKVNNLLEDEEKYSLPPAFLMEMMDLNEAISDYEDMPGNENARLAATNNLTEQLQAWETTTNALTTRYDAGEHNNTLLLQIKDMYFRKKYLLRIKERIDRFAAQL